MFVAILWGPHITKFKKNKIDELAELKYLQ